MFEIRVRGDAYEVSETELRTGEAKRAIRFRGTYYVVCKRRFPTKRDAQDFVDDFQSTLKRTQHHYLRFAACKGIVEGLEALGWEERELHDRAKAELLQLASQFAYTSFE